MVCRLQICNLALKSDHEQIRSEPEYFDGKNVNPWEIGATIRELWKNLGSEVKMTRLCAVNIFEK